MNRLPLIATLAIVSTAALAQQPTRLCNAKPWFNRVELDFAQGVPAIDPRYQAIIAAVQNPSSNPPLYDRLARPTEVFNLGTSLLLGYDPIQDPVELAARVFQATQSDAPFSRGRPFGRGGGCPIPEGGQILGIAEYYNNSTNRYYLSASDAEKSWLDSGGGGGGWGRTGQVWTTHAPGEPECTRPAYQPVYQFYSAERHAHYYTMNAEECGWLRNNPGWTYVAVPFGVQERQACTVDTPGAVTMLYNPQDPSHRFSSDAQITEAMRAQGWQGSGAQFCVKAVGAP